MLPSLQSTASHIFANGKSSQSSSQLNGNAFCNWNIFHSTLTVDFQRKRKSISLDFPTSPFPRLSSSSSSSTLAFSSSSSTSSSNDSRSSDMPPESSAQSSFSLSSSLTISPLSSIPLSSRKLSDNRSSGHSNHRSLSAERQYRFNRYCTLENLKVSESSGFFPFFYHFFLMIIHEFT